MLRKDYYVTLGVLRTESPSGIRSAFRTLVKRYHPERVGLRGTEFVKDILTAYHVLCDPEKRGFYDQGLLHAEGNVRGAESAITVGTERQETSLTPTVVQQLHVRQTSWPPTESIAAQIWSSFARAEAIEQQPLRSLNVHIVLSPTEAASGGSVVIPIPVFYPCATCGGSGRNGLVPCTSCDAQGMMEEEETVRIRVPAMVEDYRCVEMPVRGLGLHNLYLRVYIRVE